jgi:hypothetical protein
MDDLAVQGIAVLIPPDSGKRKDERPGWTGGRFSLDTPFGVRGSVRG